VREVGIRFVEKITNDDVVLMVFRDPAPVYAIAVEPAANAVGEAASDPQEACLNVVLLPSSTSTAPQSSPPVSNVEEDAVLTAGSESPPTNFIKYRGVELTFRPGHATLQCDPDQADVLLAALVEFARYELELRRIEDAIAAGWAELEQDKRLAFEVKPADLHHTGVVGGRMEQVLHRRICLARIEPHLFEADAKLPAAAQQLGAELRDKAKVEARLEAVDGQLEVFEHIYEMSSQRIGEYRAAREEHTLEWIIIVLLAAETFALLAQIVWKFRV
jgi:hypothetical protein